jgi:hypothetical protein
VVLTALDYSSDVTTGFVGEILLSGKNSEDWSETEPKATVYYTLIGDKFAFKTESDVEDSVLIYYPDANEYRDWNIENAILIGDVDSEWAVRDLSNLPLGSDWNQAPTPDYCDFNNGIDDYLHCSGAKFWIMKASDFESEAWNPGEMLFETDLVSYTDSTAGEVEVLVPAEGSVTLFVQATVDKYASGGDYPITVTVA